MSLPCRMLYPLWAAPSVDPAQLRVQPPLAAKDSAALPEEREG
eukprot:CAMPEP_0118985918 /NCGR_PEP_ID=MMETSP1173-20130426/41017_1 /TAXON_ID=1034831 /ORGANISM="Rhizochromulina marina cf, Strain CCMP1243" /LENGTH=42 /DNA_ID= /DNA_START= /DNA_END= /DNA_ORIENTATION=